MIRLEYLIVFAIQGWVVQAECFFFNIPLMLFHLFVYPVTPISKFSHPKYKIYKVELTWSDLVCGIQRAPMVPKESMVGCSSHQVDLFVRCSACVCQADQRENDVGFG